MMTIRKCLLLKASFPTLDWSAKLLGLLLAMAALPVVAQDDTSMPAIPDYYQEPGMSRTKGYENQAVNEAIDTFTGKLQYHFTDFFIPGNGGMDLVVQRSYTAVDDPLATGSPWPMEFSPAGLGWTMHFGRIIRGANLDICSTNWSNSGKNPVLEMPDGQRRVLYEYDQTTPTMWVTKDFWRATCNLSSGARGLNVDAPDGTRYEMTTPGHTFGDPGQLLQTYYTTRVVDRNGNTLSVTYTTVNGVRAVARVSSSDGRQLNFSYGGSGISSISDGERTWNYTMVSGAGGRTYLAQVTRPDGLAWKFGYRSASPGTGSLSRVEYPAGGSIDYSYDHVHFRPGVVGARQSTVIKTKRASPGSGSTNPVGEWSYSYAPATAMLPFTQNGNETTYYYAVPPEGVAPNGGAFSDNQLDITTVTGPDDVVKHYHAGARSLQGRGVGTYKGRVSSLEVVQLSYVHLPISAQQDATGSVYGNPDMGTYAPLVDSEFRGIERGPGGGYYASHEVIKSGHDVWGNPSTIEEIGFGGSTGAHRRTRGLTYDVNTSKWLIRQVSGETVTVGDESHVTNRRFDGNGNVLQETVAGVPTTLTYSSAGDVLTLTNALNQTTTYSNYKRGIAQSELQPGAVSLSRVVDNAGNITSETNGRGFATAYTYDGLNRVTRITPPEGNPVVVDYGARSRTVTRGAMVNTQTFDGLGRLVRSAASAPGEATIAVDYRHDPKGRRIFQSFPNSTQGVGYSYDTLDRVIETTFPPLNGQSYSVLTSYTGLRTLQRDTTDRFTARYHRSFGNPGEQQVMEVWQGRSSDGRGFSTFYEARMQRNVLGQITRLEKGHNTEEGVGAVRLYGYNNRYHLVSQTDPEVGTTTYGRDLLGNLTEKRIGTQPAVVYGLDARNRVRTVSYAASENSAVPRAPNLTFTYLNTDVMESVTGGGVVRRYNYDGADKITTETLVADPNRTFTMTYAYDANEALSTVTYPSGATVSLSPDGFGRPRAVSPYVSQVNYHPNGMPSTITYGNGVVTEMGLNDRLWPSSLEVKRNGPSIVNNLYGYDLVGNLTSVADSVDSQYNRTFSYDVVNRLTGEVGAGRTLQYRYDNVGNIAGVNRRVSVNGSPLWVLHKYYGYDDSTGGALGSGRLLFLEDDFVSRAFSYDAAGNVISDGHRGRYGYDRANNMRCANCGLASQILHVYDGTNMRVKTTENGNTTYSMYDHRGLLMFTERVGVERKELFYLGRRQVAERRIPSN